MTTKEGVNSCWYNYYRTCTTALDLVFADLVGSGKNHRLRTWCLLIWWEVGRIIGSGPGVC